MIERLLALKLDVVECEAEAWLNGIPVARASVDDPHVVLPAHEFTLAGDNRLELTVWPRHPATPDSPPLRIEASGRASAQLRLLLPRVGHPVDPSSARTLAELIWAPQAGEFYEAPVAVTQQLTLPLGFPRWRWLDAPKMALDDTTTGAVHAYLLPLAEALTQGDPQPFLAASRWRVEELAIAYQTDPREALAQMHAHFIACQAAGGLRWLSIKPDDLLLRPVADGRLLECLDLSGQPYLRTEPDDQGVTLSLPMRLAQVDRKFYVLR